MPASKAAKNVAKKATAKKANQVDTPVVVDADAVTVDRRRNERRDGNPEALDTGVMQSPRRKKQRRRHIDPTTCERDYNNEEIEFMRAMDDYKHDSGRMFPTCSEVLEVIRALGYVRLSEEEMELLQVEEFDPAADVDNEVDGEEAELEDALEA